MGLLCTLRFCIRHLVPCRAMPLCASGCAPTFFAVPCLRRLSHSVAPSAKRLIGEAPGRDSDPTQKKQTLPGSRSGAFLYSGVLTPSTRSSVHGGGDGQQVGSGRRWQTSGIDGLDLLGCDGDGALSMELRTRNVESDEHGKQRKIFTVTKEKLELRSKIAKSLVLDILDLDDISLIGQFVNEWLRNLATRRNTLSILENLSGNGASSNNSSAFVPYAQVARIVNAVMQDLGQRGHFEAALEILTWMERQGWGNLDPHIYTTVIDTLGNAGSLELAEKIFESLDSMQVKKDAALYNAMLNARGKAGQIDLLEDLFESMKHHACKPDLVTYNTVMNSYVKAGMGLGTVVSLFRDMYARGIDPDLVSFDILLQACISGQHVGEAQKILQNLKKRGLKPSVVTYTTLITLHANSGQSMEALGLLTDMLAANCHPNTQTFSSLITACGRGGNILQAERLFEVMENLGVERNIVTYNAMIDMYGKCGDSRMAQKKFEDLEQAGLKPNGVTISSLMSSFKTAGAYDKVLSFYERAKQDSICNEYVFAEAIDACIKWGRLQNIAGMKSDMVATNCSPNVVTCSIILVGLGSRCSDAEDAGVLVNFLQGFESDLTVNCCRMLLEQFHSDEELIHNIQRLYLLLDNEDEKTWTIFSGALVDALWMLGWYRRAAHVVAWVMKRGLFDDICVIQQREWKLDLRRLSSGTALVALYQWLGHLLIVARNLEESGSSAEGSHESMLRNASVEDTEDESCVQKSEDFVRVMRLEVLLPLLPLPEALKDLQGSRKCDLGGEFPPFVTIVTGWGKMSKQEGSSVLKALVQEELLKLRAPFRPSADFGRWIAQGEILITWFSNPETAAHLALSDLAS